MSAININYALQAVEAAARSAMQAEQTVQAAAQFADNTTLHLAMQARDAAEAVVKSAARQLVAALDARP